MNSKQLTLLVLLCVVLGGLGWLAWNKQNDVYSESAAQLGEKLLPNFPLNDVTQITIRQPSNTIALIKKDDVWVVSDRGDYPANFSNISDLLKKFWESKVAKPVKVGPSRLPQLELIGPDKGSGTLVEFKAKDGKAIPSVLLGAKTMREAGAEAAAFGGGAFPNGRYVMVGGDPKHVALITETFATADGKTDEWLNKDWFKVEKIKSVSVVSTNATNNFKVLRDSETADWKLADAKGEEKLDNAKAGGVFTALSSPSFQDVSTNGNADAIGLAKPPITATIETFDGFTYTVKVGNTSGEGDDRYFQIGMTGNFPKDRTPGKDEKPEDKAKLDKEFADNLKKLEERLKADLAYTKRSYVVSKWTIDPLLKERKDLLAEKKEEPKAEDKPLPPVPLK